VTADGTLSNPVTLYKLAGAALHNVVLSDGLNRAQTLVGLAGMLRGMSTANMLFVQYPVVDDPADSARVIVDQTTAHALNVALQTDEKTTLGDSSTGRASEDQSASTGSPSAAPSAPAAAPATTAPSTGTSAGTDAGAAATPTALPSTITGQSAAEQTCSVGN
jgi:hypothetical protein